MFYEGFELSFYSTGQVSSKGIEIFLQIHIRKFEEHMAGRWRHSSSSHLFFKFSDMNLGTDFDPFWENLTCTNKFCSVTYFWKKIASFYKYFLCLTKLRLLCQPGWRVEFSNDGYKKYSWLPNRRKGTLIKFSVFSQPLRPYSIPYVYWFHR